MSDPRVDLLRRGLRIKSEELNKHDALSYEYFRGLAEEAIRILEDYYGSARYWMAAQFERETVLREIEKKVDEIRDANISS